jgi:cellobiose phosphorylase
LRRFATAYGSFAPDGTEYIIETPRTPRPWVNVISNGDYGLVLSQTGSGYSWRGHAQLNRITRWDQDLIRDEWGKYIYLRDEKGNIWSAGWKPVCAEPSSYRCRNGFGYSIIESMNFGIETELLVFVPVDDPLEIWRLTVRNNTRKKRTIDLSTYFEWCLGQSPDWHREFHKSFIETSYDPASHSILAVKRLWEVPSDRGHWNTSWPYVAFHSSSVRASSFDTDKESFLGMYGSPALPAAVNGGKHARNAGNGIDPVASLRVRLELPPGAEKVVCFTLGAADSRKDALNLASRYKKTSAVDAALKKVKERWQNLLGTVSVETPDDSMNLLQNSWLKYQAISGRLWGRTAYYQTGGAFGFRDQLQDSQLWLVINPELTKKQLLLHARHQFADGSVYHWWHPMSEIGLKTQISDNLLWLPFVLNNYIQETNDFGILECREPFVDITEQATLYDHACRAIDKALTRFSDRGLPLIGGGDWNDGLNAVGLDGKGESVWLGHFIHRILLDSVPIAEQQRDGEHAREWKARAANLRAALNDRAWDGHYYFGATKDSGGKLGSEENTEGSLWLNPQTWAVIAGVADPDRASAVMDVVEKKLDTEIGPLLLHPAYRTPDKEIGYLTRYSPGMRENGGVYTHGATWAVVAAAILGRGKSAYRMYSELNPINRGMNPKKYVAEPYVTPGNIEGPDSPFFGRGGWTWYSGSAAWLFKVGLESILGIRPSLEGLVVDPCIPPDWKKFRVRRTFRGTVYEIEVRNPGAVQSGVKEALVDGKQITNSGTMRGVCLPPGSPGTTVRAVVTMGR